MLVVAMRARRLFMLGGYDGQVYYILDTDFDNVAYGRNLIFLSALLEASRVYVN